MKEEERGFLESQLEGDTREKKIEIRQRETERYTREIVDPERDNRKDSRKTDMKMGSEKMT